MIPQVEFEGKQIWMYENTNMTVFPLTCGHADVFLVVASLHLNPLSGGEKRRLEIVYVCVHRLCFLGLVISIIWETPSMMPQGPISTIRVFAITWI